MKTFYLRDGDLALGPSGYALITGATKVKQDISVAIREPLGCDRFHPKWGTILADLVGTVVDDELRLRIHSEVTRLVANYVAQQSEVLVYDHTRRLRLRLTPEEIVSSVQEIRIIPQADRVYLKVIIHTVARDAVTLTSTVAA